MKTHTQEEKMNNIDCHLNGLNYDEWEKRIWALLEAKGLAEAEELEEEPRVDETKPETVKARSNFRQARGLIVNSFDAERLGMINSRTMTPKAILKEFEIRYKENQTDIAMALREQVEIKPEMGSMVEYFNKFESLYYKARKVGLPEISQKWRIYWL